MSSRRAIALPFVMLIIALLLIGVATVARQGLGSLNQAKVDRLSKQAVYAAEAGAADAVRNLVVDDTWEGPLDKTEMEIGATYSADVYNNFNGGGASITAPNGTVVPSGFAYVVAEGRYAGMRRRVGLMVQKGSPTALGLSIAVGGNIDLQGNKTLRGSIKASGDINIQGNTEIISVDTNGRVLAGGNINSQGNTKIDDSQDVRARGNITQSPDIDGALLVYKYDSTPATTPFINDWRETNTLAPDEEGMVLPNPDQDMLTDQTVNPNIVVHPENTISSDLNLNGKIHYFPWGVNVSANLLGQGTLVTGHGQDMTFQSGGTYNANLVALRDEASGSLPKITFQGNATINGLVYSHGDVDIQGNLNHNGVIVTYKGNLITQGSTEVTLNSTVLANTPGFEPWVNGFNPAGGSTTGGTTGGSTGGGDDDTGFTTGSTGGGSTGGGSTGGGSTGGGSTGGGSTGGGSTGGGSTGGGSSGGITSTGGSSGGITSTSGGDVDTGFTTSGGSGTAGSGTTTSGTTTSGTTTSGTTTSGTTTGGTTGGSSGGSSGGTAGGAQPGGPVTVVHWERL